MPELRHRQRESGPRGPAASGVRRDDENPVGSAPGKRPADFDRRKAISNEAMRALLERLDLDEGAGDVRRDKARNESTQAKPKPRPSIVRFDERSAGRPTPRSGRALATRVYGECSGSAAAKSANFEPLRRDAEPGFRVKPQPAAPGPAAREAVLDGPPRQQREAGQRAAHARLEHFVAGCRRVIGYFRVPKGAQLKAVI